MADARLGKAAETAWLLTPVAALLLAFWMELRARR
jgi:hypothetical protein